MASSIIHMCIAKKINEKLRIPDENMLLFGSIAPDISKLVGQTKEKSHFLTTNKVVDIDKFIQKYKDKLKHPFILGYFIHLYTDYLWDKYFISDIISKNTITLLDGTKVENTEENYRKLIYNDYTNLNIQLIDYYHLDLSLFYNEIKLPDIEMEEIPIKKLHLLIEHTDTMIQNTKKKKEYTFKLENILPFIELSSQLIYFAIKE